ncbi:MAG: DUF389 domain-containing protein [Flavobacteriaceae bacterium]
MESKFNFDDDKTSAAKADVQRDAQGFFRSALQFLRLLLSFRKDTDYKATLEAVKADIPFRGATAWVLICSIFLASIGLNANSTAVVIGAMLIAPLMGPVLGVGVSLALNDVETLRRSMVNFLVMVLLSVATATLFFAVFPLREESSELLARVSPDIRDVLIAFFGGLALIIARTKKGTIASVIFGVAIATALMPPLCTVGYGLAQANIAYALGALYLFTINAIFIALAAYLVVKLLRFPMTQYANAKKRKRTSRMATLLAILMMIPAGFTFVEVLQKSQFETSASSFLEQELIGLPHSDYLKQTARIEYGKDSSKVVINTFGMDPLAPEVVALLQNRMRTYDALLKTELIVNQQERQSDLVNSQRYLKELRKRDSLDLIQKEQQIAQLTEEVRKLSGKTLQQVSFAEIAKEMQVISPLVVGVSYAQTYRSNFSTIDTLMVFGVEWKSGLDSIAIADETVRLKNWLALKLEDQPFEIEQKD